MKRASLLGVALSLTLAACTSRGPAIAIPTPTGTTSPSLTPSPSASKVAPVVFDGPKAFATDDHLSRVIGARVAASAGYDRAATYVASRFESFGYRVKRQRVSIPSGTSEGTPVVAGTSDNVIAGPADFDPGKPHLIVGAHLDTVVPSPGANDNGSGVAAVIELARLAALDPDHIPTVFIAFTGEERRFKGPTGAMFGSRAYLSSLSASERGSIRGVLVLDMIGNGPISHVCHRLTESPRRLLDHVLVNARRLGIAAREDVITQFFSDHVPFEEVGIPVAWLWAGDHPTVHTPRDTMNIVSVGDVARNGRLAWEAIKTYR